MCIPFRALIGKICEKHDAPQIFLVVPRKKKLMQTYDRRDVRVQRFFV